MTQEGTEQASHQSVYWAHHLAIMGRWGELGSYSSYTVHFQYVLV